MFQHSNYVLRGQFKDCRKLLSGMISCASLRIICSTLSVLHSSQIEAKFVQNAVWLLVLKCSILLKSALDMADFIAVDPSIAILCFPTKTELRLQNIKRHTASQEPCCSSASQTDLWQLNLQRQLFRTHASVKLKELKAGRLDKLNKFTKELHKWARQSPYLSCHSGLHSAVTWFTFTKTWSDDVWAGPVGRVETCS